jgi:hypothetical protein
VNLPLTILIELEPKIRAARNRMIIGGWEKQRSSDSGALISARHAIEQGAKCSPFRPGSTAASNGRDAVTSAAGKQLASAAATI